MYRRSLPQLSDAIFLTDSGIETDLIFRGGFELPEFAAFVLLDDEAGDVGLREYFLTARGCRSQAWIRAHSRGADMAGQSRMGRSAGLFTRTTSKH